MGQSVPPRAEAAGDRWPSDAEWVAGVLSARPEAFDRFFEAFYPPVYAHAARHAADPEAARALAERILRRVLRALPRFAHAVGADATAGAGGAVPLAGLVMAHAWIESLAPLD